MRVYIKIHVQGELEIIACCDEDLLNQVFKEGTLKIEISHQFFGGKLINLEEAIEILREASYFNIVGENVIKKAIDCKILQHYKVIAGVPMALKMMF